MFGGVGRRAAERFEDGAAVGRRHMQPAESRYPLWCKRSQQQNFHGGDDDAVRVLLFGREP